MNTKQHYENHLAEYYSWMFGSFEEKLRENKNFFTEHDTLSSGGGIAIDLGAGSGLQSIPLAELGFKVTAVDFSRKLLDELNSRKGNLNIETVEADIMDFERYSHHKPELIVCMGDTLTHLNSAEDVKSLFSNCEKILEERGKLILSFRDLNFELKEENRFIPVRGDEDTVFTCFLEYEKEFVKVYDIINKKTDSKWIQNISSYKKLKLSLEQVNGYLENGGFEIIFSENLKGFLYIIAKR